MKKMLKIMPLAVLAAMLASCTMVGAISDGIAVKPFAPGERVTFLGDSITHGGSFHANLQLFWDLRFPGSGTRLMNCGVSGGVAGGGVARWDYDVLPQHADRVFVMFGMNDVGHSNYSPGIIEDEKVLAKRTASLDAYRKNMTKIADLVQSSGKKLVLVTPTPYDEYSDIHTAERRVGADSLGLASFASFCRELAADRNAEIVEFYAPLAEFIRSHRESRFCRADRVHPTPEGHIIMAALVLKEMGVSPFVAQVEIGADGRVAKVANAAVSEVNPLQGGLSFRYAPATLPFPVTEEYRRADAEYSVSDMMNIESLKVYGLPAGEYELQADGVSLGKFSAKSLASGVNLALMQTPASRLAQSAWKISRELVGLQARQRSLVLVEKIAVGRGAKANDYGDICAKMEAYVDKLKKDGSSSAGYYFGQLAIYRRDKPKIDQIRADEDDCRLRLASAAARKASYVMSIRPCNAPAQQ